MRKPGVRSRSLADGLGRWKSAGDAAAWPARRPDWPAARSARRLTRAVALGQPAPVRPGQQGVVRVGRLRPTHHRLQQAVDAGGRQQVLAAGHQGHALHRVVMGDAQVVAGRRVPPRRAPRRQRPAGRTQPAASLLGEAERAGAAGAAATSSRQACGCARRDAARPSAAAGCGRCRDRPPRPARAAPSRRGAMSARLQKQGYSRPRPRKRVQHDRYSARCSRLHPHRAVPVQPEPGAGPPGARPRTPGGSAPASMSSIRSRKRPPAARARPPRDQRRVDMAEMQQPGRAGGEARW